MKTLIQNEVDKTNGGAKCICANSLIRTKETFNGYTHTAGACRYKCCEKIGSLYWKYGSQRHKC